MAIDKCMRLFIAEDFTIEHKEQYVFEIFSLSIVFNSKRNVHTKNVLFLRFDLLNMNFINCFGFQITYNMYVRGSVGQAM